MPTARCGNVGTLLRMSDTQHTSASGGFSASAVVIPIITGVVGFAAGYLIQDVTRAMSGPSDSAITAPSGSSGAPTRDGVPVGGDTDRPMRDGEAGDDLTPTDGEDGGPAEGEAGESESTG